MNLAQAVIRTVKGPVVFDKVGRGGSRLLSRCFLFCFFYLLSFAGVAYGASSPGVYLGRESLFPFPVSAKYNLDLNTRPRDGESVALNPPRFSWSYTPLPTSASADQRVYEFQFQISASAGFSSLLADAHTSVNCWNFVGLLPVNTPLYWRVIYSVNGVSVATNVQTFSVASGATNWDRSFLADTNYWNTNAVHPRIWFNAQTRPALSNWLRTNISVRTDWSWNTNFAYQYITNSWWTLPDPTTKPGGAGFVHQGTWASAIYMAAFTYQMTGDRRFVTGPTNICQRASDLASFVIKNGFDVYDTITLQTDDCIRGLGLTYDWLYNDMTPVQRSNVLYAIERCARFSLKGSGAFEYPKGTVNWFTNDPLASYTGSFVVNDGSLMKRGNNHPQIWLFNHYLCALAAYENGPWSRELVQRTLNLFISRPYGYSDDGHINSGRGYSAEDMFNSGLFHLQMISGTVFPGLHPEKNPYWQEQAQLWSYLTPVGFWEKYEPWGDLGQQGYLSLMRMKNIARDLADFVSDGRLWLHWTNAVNYYGSAGQIAPVWQLPVEFYYPPPQPQTNTITARAFPYGGWAISSTYEPNTKRGFMDGCGFILSGNPPGWTGSSHGSPSALDLQLWAYGAALNESGYGFAQQSKVGWTHNIPAFNGSSLFNDGRAPYFDYLARIIAFTNTDTFTYAAVDGTRSYAVVNYPDDTGGWLMPGEYANHHRNAEAAALTKMQRHLLFMRKKYFVIYDDCAAETNSTFSWIWQVPLGLANLSGADFQYRGTNEVSGSNVLVYVKQVVGSSLLTITNLAGKNSLINPITGEDYAPGGTWNAGTAQPNAYDALNSARATVMVVTNGVSKSVDFQFTTKAGEAGGNLVYVGANPGECFTNLITAMIHYFPGCFEVVWKSANQVRLYLTPLVTYTEMSTAYSPISVNYNSFVTPRANAIWVSNKNPAMNFHFLTVVYPLKPSDPAPTITRLSDNSVRVQQGTNDDVISFGETNASPASTLVIDTVFPGPPRQLRPPNLHPL